MKPIAFVIPWYGDDIRGGAESECNQLAHCLQKAGIAVEVLTTCVKEASSNRSVNTLPEGESVESGVLVRRFKVRQQNIERFNQANLKLYHNERVTLEEEKMYWDEDINSPDMYAYIRTHKDDYKYFIFMPYLYGPTYHGSIECPDNAVIIPCFHDEAYAYMQTMRERASNFKKMIFLSKPESDLAHKLYDLSDVDTAILGAYVESGWENECNADAFRKKYKIQEDFVLYAGRKDPGKKADELIEYFSRYKRLNPQRKIKLIMIGGGSLEIPIDCQNDIIDLGFVSLEDKHNAFAAATIFCNPSYFESFSIVIMESWLVKRPILVSEHCKVTMNFCLESNGGLYFDEFGTFAECMDYMLDNKEIADKMGQNGYEYVQNHFVHDVILKKYVDMLELNDSVR